MKSSSKFFYLFLGLIVMVVLLVFTILELSFTDERDDNITREEIDIDNNDTMSAETNKNNDEITEDTIIEYETYYSKCEDTIRDFELNKTDLIGMNKGKLEEELEGSGREILVFDDSRVIIKSVKNHLCPNHYVVGEKDGNVAIYKIGKEGERILFKSLDQPIQLLGEQDINKLKEGIVVNNLDDIGEVIENFIS